MNLTPCDRLQINSVQPQQINLILHQSLTTPYEFRAKQEALTSGGNVLEGAGIHYYSHICADDIYSELVKILSHSLLASLAQVLARDREQTLAKRLSIVKHRITRLVLPIDIDLQGLAETDFLEDYWQEVTEIYKNEKAIVQIDEARKLIYKKNTGQETVEDIVDQVKKSINNDKIQDIEGFWKKIQYIFPDVDEKRHEEISLDPDTIRQQLYKIYCEAKILAKALGERDQRDTVKSKLKNDNPFHKWLVELDNTLDQLRNALHDG